MEFPALIFPALSALGGFTAGLLQAELSGAHGRKCIFKTLASLSFLVLALACGALGSVYGLLIFAGLLLCAVGDACLLPEGTGESFRRGVFVFFGGHVYYILASIILWHPDVLSSKFMLGLPVLFCMIVPLYQKFRKQSDALIEVYTGIIILLIAASVLSALKTGIWILPAAAVLFAISDIFVSRNRFGPSSPKQFWVITPFYFVAQAFFAMSILYA